MEREDCLNYNEECKGAVEYRMPLSGSGRSYPRCDHHWNERLDIQEQVNRRYGGVNAPSDFDPYYAGESWDEDGW